MGVNEHELMAGVVDAADKLLKESTPEALRELRERMATLRGWQEESHEIERPRHLRVQVCKVCPAVIFFACEVDDADDPDFSPVNLRRQWMPFEVDPIDAEGVLPEWRWTVNFAEYPPRCQVDLTTTALVYVDHRKTCGALAGPKKYCTPYERRWKANVAKTNAGMDNESIRATNDLLALQRRLADRRGHDDS
jgi:hypothetical protein